MAQVQQRFLSTRGPRFAAFVLFLSDTLGARRFYDDDPLLKEPSPVRVEKAQRRKLDNLYDFFHGTFAEPGERQPPGKPIRARSVNTLDEAPDSAWYTSRHWRRRMSLQELARGAGAGNPPADGKWKVVAAKAEGVTPGFTMDDSRGRRYFVKLDPLGYPELGTAAETIGSKFFYALGYNTPENYPILFDRARLTPSPTSRFVDLRGKERPIHTSDIYDILMRGPSTREKQYRAVASLGLPGQLLGPFRFHGVRKDDPNDTVPHEHRRELRGLFVFCAWLGHNDAKSLNSQDTLIDEGGQRYIRHYLLDFSGTLGSDSFTVKSPRAGNEYLFSWKKTSARLFSFGIYVPRWAMADYPDIEGAGRFESRVFDPEKWMPNYPIPAFLNRLPDDEFWAAKQVMAFTDDEIHTIVKTGELSDPRAADWLTKVLIERRDKIGRTYFAKVLPLDRFEMRDGALRFEDLAVKHGFTAPRQYSVQWSFFDNDAEKKTRIEGDRSLEAPAAVRSAQSGYAAVDISAADPAKTVTVYFRIRSGSLSIVGVERTW